MKETSVPRDRLLRCTECGTEFLYSAGEQRRRLAGGARGLPELCPGCLALEGLIELAPAGDEPGGDAEIGNVKWYDRRKGFGFLVGEGGEQFFFHRSSLPRGKRAPRRGEAVHFTRKQGKRGLEAIDVRLAGRRPAQATGQKQIDTAEETITHES